MKKLLDVARHNPQDSKKVKNQLPKSRSILIVDEKVISRFLILFTQTAKEKPFFLRVSTVRILPSVVVHKKKATRGALIFQTLFQGKELCSTDYNRV
jgi:hypothetical protein